MTSRSAPPPSPDQYAQEFVTAALGIVRREAPNGTSARLRMDKTLGGHWQLWTLGDAPRLLAQQHTSIGRAQALDGAARDLVRASLARLDVADAAWLVRKMHDRRDEQTPGHFRIALDVDRGAWQLRVVAHHSGGCACCTVAEIAGTTVEHQAAA